MTLSIDDVNRQRLLDVEIELGSDARQKPQRLVITAEQHVLAVVDTLARDRVDKRGCPSTEAWSRLEHQHFRAPLGKQCRGTQASKAGADHNHIWIHRYLDASAPRCAVVVRSVRSQTRRAITAR